MSMKSKGKVYWLLERDGPIPHHPAFTSKAHGYAVDEVGPRSRSVYSEMAPDTFLELAMPGMSDEKAAGLVTVAQFSSYPFLQIDGYGRITGHEGRHRARELKRRGFIRMPVLLHHRVCRWDETGAEHPNKLISENGEIVVDIVQAHSPEELTQRLGGVSAAQRLAKRPAHYHLSPTTRVQSLLFAKDTFTRQAAEEWALTHGFHVSKIESTANNWRIRQVDPIHVGATSFRTISFRPGVQAVIARDIVP